MFRMCAENLNAKLKVHFENWSDDECEKFFKFATKKQLAECATVFAEGSEAVQFFFLAEGSVEVTNSEGDTIAEFIDGEVFGQFEFMTHSKYNAHAKTKTPCTVFVFPKDGTTLHDFANDEPALYAKIIRAFLVFVSRRTRNATGLLKENSPLTKQIKKQLYSDKLTGVYNKTFLEENLKELFTDKTSLITFKLDNFKAVNDRFGHEAGDAVLVLIGKLLKEGVPHISSIVRYEGNIFMIITKNHTAQEAKNLADSILHLIESANLNEAVGLSHDEKPFTISACLVVTLFPDDGCNAHELIIKNAGLPVELIKAGKRGVILFSDGGTK